MIRIKELYRLQNIGNLRLLAGQGGLERTVTEAVLFEYDPSRIQLPDFYNGDLVVTTLAYARGDERLMTDSLLALMSQGVASLMVKTAYFTAMPQAVLDMANQLQTPLFLFDDTYIEEVIVQVTDLIRGKRHFSGYEKELDELMRGEIAPERVKACFRRIAPFGTGGYRVAAFAPTGGIAELDEKLYALMNQRADLTSRVTCMEWKRMILVLLREGAGEPTEILQAAGMKPDALHVGVSDERTDDTAFGMALCEAVYAARGAKMQGKRQLCAAELGMYAYLLPMSENAYVRDLCCRSLGIIREYDMQNRTTLEQTARIYIRENMEIAAAAKALYQHPNTVRYRIGKIAKLMGLEGSAMFEPMLCIVVGLSEIMREEG